MGRAGRFNVPKDVDWWQEQMDFVEQAEEGVNELEVDRFPDEEGGKLWEKAEEAVHNLKTYIEDEMQEAEDAEYQQST